MLAVAATCRHHRGERYSSDIWDDVQRRYLAATTERVQDIADSHGMTAPGIYMRAKAAGWGPRPTVLGVTRPRPVERPRYQWRDGDRLCRSCKGRTRSNPCNICGGISDPGPGTSVLPPSAG